MKMKQQKENHQRKATRANKLKPKQQPTARKKETKQNQEEK